MAQNKKVAFLMSNQGVEEVELTKPWKALKEAGYELTLIAPENTPVQTVDGSTPSNTYEVDMVLSDANPDDFDLLVLPGGVANPDYLRLEKPAVDFVRTMIDQDKLVAVICHAPWMLAEADVLRNRDLTSYPSLKTDMINAGGNWHDKEVVICRNGSGILITSRSPDDIPAFNEAILSHLSEQQAAGN